MNDWKNGYTLSQLLNRSMAVDLNTLETIESKVFNLIKNNTSIIEKCPNVLDYEVKGENSRYFIKAPIFRNCVLIAAHFGPFTVNETALMLGITEDSVLKIQKNAIKKLYEKLNNLKINGDI